MAEERTDKRCELCAERIYLESRVRKVRDLEVCGGCEESAWLGVNPIIGHWPNKEAREAYMEGGRTGDKWRELVERAERTGADREDG